MKDEVEDQGTIDKFVGMGSVTNRFFREGGVFLSTLGSGKTTMSLLACPGLALSFAVSACTRLPRPGCSTGKITFL
jgi:hypothetical protein